MTIEEFNKTQFSAGMKMLAHDEESLIMAVDFEEALLGVDGGDGDIRWLRCENCELIA